MPPARAADRFWIGSGSFNSPGNWFGGVAPGTGDRAIFQEDAGASQSDVTAGIDVGGIVFRAGGAPATTLSLTTGDLTLTQSGIVNEDTRTVQFVNVGDQRTLTFDNGTRANDAVLITVSAGGVVSFRGAGPAGQVPSGADLQLDGTLVVSTADAAVTFDDLNGSGAIRFDAAGSVDVRAGTFSGDIEGAEGQLLFRRRGSVTFTGDSASTGISADVGFGANLTIGDGFSSGSFAGDLATAGSLIFDRSDTRTYAGALSGTSATAAVFIGSGGELRLTGDNSGYTQSYIVREGSTLALDTGTGVLADNRISIGAGSTFRFDAPRDYTFGGAFVGGADATVTIAGDATTVTLTGDSSGFTGDVNVGFNSGLRIGNGGATGNVQSDIRLGESAVLTFDRGDAFTYGGSISGGTFLNKNGAGVTTLTGVSDFRAFAAVNAGTLRLANGGTLGVPSLRVAAGATFDVNGQSQTLRSLVGSGDITLGAGTLTLDVGAVFLSQFDGVISGTGGLTKTGGSSAQLGGQNTYTGATNVAEGVLSLVNDGPNSGRIGSLSAQTALTIGEIGTFDLNGRDQTVASLSGAGAVTLGAGRLTVDQVGSTAYAGTISGSGGLTKAGAGTLTLTGANAYSGLTTISDGVLALGAGGATGSVAGDIANDATLAINRSDTLVYGGRLTGAGTIQVNGGAGSAFVLTGDSSTYTGDVSVSPNAVFQVGVGGTSGAFGGDVDLQISLPQGRAAFVFDRSDDVTYGGVVSGGGVFIKQGAGVLELTNANTNDATSVANGTLRLGAGGSLGPDSSLVVSAGAIFDLNGRDQTFAAIGGAGSIALGDGALTFDGPINANFSGVISGTGGFTKEGAGLLRLFGANTYTGATTINEGAIRLVDAGALSSATALTVNGAGAFDLNGRDQTVAALSGASGGSVFLGGGALTVDGVADTSFAGSVSGVGDLTKDGTGTLTLTGANGYLGATTVSGGTLRLGAGGSLSSQTALQVAGSGVFDLNGRNQTVQNLSGDGAVTLGVGRLTAGAATDGTFDGVISGAGGGFTKAGGGTLTLTGANTYTGSTMVSGGALNVTGSLVSDATVESGATLRGSGALADVTVGNGGALSPDGVLRLRATALSNGSVTFDQGSNFRIRTTGVQNDLLLAEGFADLSGGTVRVQANGGYNASTTYIILNAQAALLSEFAGVTTDLAFIDPTLTYDSNNVFLTFNSANFVTPEQSNAQNSVGEALTVAAAQDPGGAGGEIIDRLDDLNAGDGAAALDALSGEGTAGSQEAAFFLGDAFHGAMIDQTADWRMSKSQPVQIAPVTAYAAEPAKPAAFSGLISKDPPSTSTERTWRSWFSGFGGKRDIDGTRGTADVNVRGGGGAGGVDYQINPNLLVGFSLGAGTASFSVGERNTSGDVDGAHAGLYAAATAGPAYLAASLSYSRFENDTRRRISGVGASETAKAEFDSEQLGAKVELGWRKQFETFALTPFLSLQYLDTFQEAYKERSRAAGGAPGILGLEFGDRTGSSVPLTIGLQADALIDLGNGAVWRPYGSISWQHDLSPDRGVNAALLSLPNNPFVVDAARAGQDVVRLKAGSRFSFDETRALFVDADASLSSSYNAYSVKGGFSMLFGDRKAAPQLVAGAEAPAAPVWTSTANFESKFSTFEGTRGFPAAVSVGERGRGYQLYDAITVATSGVVGSDLKVELQGRGGYVYSKQKTDGASGSVSTTTDSVLSGTVTYSGLAGYAPFLSLNLNLPTGRTVLKGSDAFARLDSDFVDLATFGEGFNIGPTLGVNVFLSPEWTATLSAGYTHRGAYDREAPVALDGGQGTQRLAPGGSGSLSAGLTYNKDTLFANANVTVSHDSATFLNNAPSFKAGDRLVVSGVAQKSWADTSRTALSGFATLGAKNKVLDPNLVVLSPEAANSNNTVFRLQLDHTFVKGQWEFGPTGSYTRRFENGFSPTTFSFVPAKEKFSLGAAAKYTFDQALSVNAKLEHFWSREKAQPDKVFLGAPLDGTGTPRLAHQGWSGMLAGAYNF